jgi:hypothetical protein
MENAGKFRFRLSILRTTISHPYRRVVLVCLFAALAATGCSRGIRRLDFVGELTRTRVADSVEVVYHFLPEHGTVTSLVLQYCPACSTKTQPLDTAHLPWIGISEDSVIEGRESHVVRSKPNPEGPGFSGRVRFPGGTSNRNDRFQLFAEYLPEKASRVPGSDTATIWKDTVDETLDYNRATAMTAALGLGVYHKSGFGAFDGFRKSGISLNYDFGVGRTFRDFTFLLTTKGTQGTHETDDPAAYTFYEYAGINASWHLRGRTRTSPFLILGGKYSRVKAADATSQVVRKGLGMEAGLGVESRFERFAYSYSSNVGGYHKFDLILATSAHPFGVKFGTEFTLYLGKYVHQGEMKLVMSLPTEIRHGYMDLEDKRPGLLKTISAMGLLYVLPFILTAD